MRVGYLGPPGTFSEQALLASAGGAGAGDAERVPLPTIREVVLALADGEVEHAVVPMENSLEGSVNEAIDTLLHDAPDVRITGETVLAVHYALVGREGADPAQAEVVISHPQALAQCARFLRTTLPGARTEHATSTAEAVRSALSADAACALATPLAAELYGGAVLLDNVEDDSSNMTRFVWLARGADDAGAGAPAGTGDQSVAAPAGADGWKTSVVFSGEGDGTPGWLVGCLAEFAVRGVNLSRIESRPAKRRLGHYLFLVDAAGRADVEGPAREAVEALAGHCEHVRVLGSYRAANDA